MLWLIIGLLISVGVWLYFKRSPQPRAKPTDKRKPVSQKPVWGKRIVIPSGATVCQAAMDMANRSFTLDKLPTLPLPDCTANINCRCHFESLKDIRSYKERRSGNERRPVLRFDLNPTIRRTGQARRAENYNPFNEEHK